jgi:hypothetical protein
MTYIILRLVVATEYAHLNDIGAKGITSPHQGNIKTAERLLTKMENN